jgi:hypothetical protein
VSLQRQKETLEAEAQAKEKVKATTALMAEAEGVMKRITDRYTTMELLEKEMVAKARSLDLREAKAEEVSRAQEQRHQTLLHREAEVERLREAGLARRAPPWNLWD